ncbi:MAG: hypothetical protein LW629_05435 [Burkholderiales bacterium]|nr:hypothetical protein [Burkholderiales bacterium]
MTILVELAMSGFWVNDISAAAESDGLSSMERMDVGKIVEIQRLQSERRFYEKVSATLCKERGSENMFPEVCGIAKAAIKNMNNGIKPAAMGRSDQDIASNNAGPSLPPLPAAKSSSADRTSDTKSLALGKESEMLVKSPRALTVGYRLVGVYGDEMDLQAELRSSGGRHYVLGMNGLVGKFRVTDVFPEGIEIQVADDEKAEIIFVAVGSQL